MVVCFNKKVLYKNCKASRMLVCSIKEILATAVANVHKIPAAHFCHTSDKYLVENILQFICINFSIFPS